MRPFITLGEDGIFYHNKCEGKVLDRAPVRVVMSKQIISVGCMDITIDAAIALLEKYKEKFVESQTVVIQEGLVK